MFRLWGKIWKDNHLLKDFIEQIDFDYLEIQVIEEDDE